MGYKNKPISLQEAIKLHQQGRLVDAENAYRLICNQDSKNVEANHYLGVIEYQKGNHELAIKLIKNAINTKPNYAQAYSNIALAYKGLGEIDLAVSNLNMAIKIKPDNTEAFFNRGNINKQQSNFKEAILDYSTVISLDEKNHAAFFSRAVCNEAIKETEIAISDYEAAINLKQDFIEAYSNLAQLQLKKGKQKEAFVIFYKILELDPKHTHTYLNMAHLFKEVGQIDSAVKAMLSIKSIDPNYEQIDGWITHYELFAAKWDNYYKNIEELKENLTKLKFSSNPFIALTSIDDPLLQYNAARKYVRNKGLEPCLKNKNLKHHNSKIRIGYYSSDFFKHATSYLMAELFELHDKDKFEIYGFSFGTDIEDEMTNRIKNSCTHFYQVNDLSGEEIANLSRKCKIDIAIDLKGYTRNARPSIFSYRAAPIQAHYLGYPGTMGNPNIDYIIADKTIIPEKYQKFYSEKIAYLPNCYQANDRQRKIAAKTPQREDYRLPSNGFIFCCFNYNYKITPEVFDSWARILKNVDGSVLWLLQDNPHSSSNLIKEAEKRGISSERLIFTEREDLPQHLSRHSLADLFLDTWPCNAHTTASDALWTGLPVITLIGNSFASRVCASLLNAIGLPELITTTIEEYEKISIELAMNASRLRTIKNKLKENKNKYPLFDTLKITRDLEKIYLKMYSRFLEDMPNNHIYID